MFFRETVDLISKTTSVSAAGDAIDSESTSTVYADKQSIRQSEFYQAMASGLRPEIMFVIRSIDYSNEKKLTWNSKNYNIIRTYDKDGELTELICEGIVATESR